MRTRGLKLPKGNSVYQHGIVGPRTSTWVETKSAVTAVETLRYLRPGSATRRADLNVDWLRGNMPTRVAPCAVGPWIETRCTCRLRRSFPVASLVGAWIDTTNSTPTPLPLPGRAPRGLVD